VTTLQILQSTAVQLLMASVSSFKTPKRLEHSVPLRRNDRYGSRLA
jgi:hypothetical protein